MSVYVTGELWALDIWERRGAAGQTRDGTPF